jgi:pimeloyl-ACP methyl ester carboxylesterase
VTRIAAALAALALAGCASLPPATPVDGVHFEAGVLTLGSRDVDVAWFRPEGARSGFMLLQHGFARHCSNLRETGARFAAAGFTVLCLNADMARGNPALAEALAAHLAQRGDAPRIVVAGHSAGGLFAAQVAATLARMAPARLAGVLLFDPVDANGALAPALAASSAPVRAFTAPPSACNANGSALAALRAIGADLPLGAGATHLDIEGGDTDPLAVAACGEGPPRAEIVTRLRGLALQAAQAMQVRSGM